jgi:hypothetical protein
VARKFAKGPELRLEIIADSSDRSIAYILKGKKYVFNNDVFIKSSDATRLATY